MAETVTIGSETYVKRNPLWALGLSIITLGIYWFVWYYKINDELRRSERDETISPTRSLMAMIFGWLIIVPPFIAMYNTAKHLQAMEQRVGIQQTLEPAISLVLMLALSIGFLGNGVYMQEHLNRAWDRAAAGGGMPASQPYPPAPPMPTA